VFSLVATIDDDDNDNGNGDDDMMYLNFFASTTRNDLSVHREYDSKWPVCRPVT